MTFTIIILILWVILFVINLYKGTSLKGASAMFLILLTGLIASFTIDMLLLVAEDCLNTKYLFTQKVCELFNKE